MKKSVSFILLLSFLLSLSGASAAADAPILDQISALSWTFSSGAGGWSTEMSIQPDGSFSGLFHDSEMGDAAEAYPDGTIYVCSFRGRLSLGRQADEHAWEILIESLVMDDAPGLESIDNGIRFITTEPYGISEGDTMTLYLPGTPTAGFTEDMFIWAHLMEAEVKAGKLENWFLYSETNQSGFVGCKVPEAL